MLLSRTSSSEMGQQGPLLIELSQLWGEGLETCVYFVRMETNLPWVFNMQNQTLSLVGVGGRQGLGYQYIMEIESSPRSH